MADCIKSVTPSQSGDQYSIMYPMPFEVLAEIFNFECRAFQKVADKKHNCIVPLNTGGHWVVLFFLGNRKKIYYLDSFGNRPGERILNLFNKCFFCWETHYSQIKLQYDSYQCGVWCSFFVVFVEYLKNYKNSVNKSESTEFLKFLSSYLIEKRKKIIPTI